jgi:hypothetical protein
MMNDKRVNIFGSPHPDNSLTPTARLFLLALYPDQSLTINNLTDFTGSTPFMIQRLGAELAKRGLVIRHRAEKVIRYSLPCTQTANHA